ncbi:MAG TPA: SpoIIE family protein phosphatase, partial [Magnetospirillaceae bacterium]|nr:SpoIIE family protein phosphatase [Magnetospirillaceae bacterium]
MSMLPARLRVLLVEDDPVAARILTRTLQNVPSSHFAVTHEGDLAGARARVRASEPFDVAILDLNLPDSAGISTLGAMLAASSTLPIVVMTGDDDPGVADLALEAGAQDYLVKGETSERVVTRAIRYAITRKLADLERQSISERLNANLAAENKRLDEESILARAMQFGLLPAQDKLAHYPQSRGLLVDSFFEPSSRIGGDLWGCAELDALRTIFYSFDFSGHGVGAALNVFRLHALMSELGGQIIDPAATLSRFNKMLVSLLPRGQYATIFLGVVDTAAGTLTWSAGGAPPPFMLDRKGRLTKLDSRGKPLGLSAAAQYTNRAIAFPEGSSLFLYSDALTESPLKQGGALGEDGLAERVRRFHTPSGIDVQGLIADFLKAAQQPIDDDMTAVAVARLAAPIEMQAVRSQASAPLLLTSRRLEVVEIGLAPPYSGYIEIGAEGLDDVG